MRGAYPGAPSLCLPLFVKECREQRTFALFVVSIALFYQNLQQLHRALEFGYLYLDRFEFFLRK